MTGLTLVFQPHGKRLRTLKGGTVLEAARGIGVNISSICGGKGFCGKCRIVVRGGQEHLSPPSESEKRALSEDDLIIGSRLACQAIATGEGVTVIEIPRESQLDQQRLLLRGLERTVKLAPTVRKLTVHLDKPSLQDSKSDVDRLVDAVGSKIGFKPNIDYEALRKVPSVLRRGDWTVTVTLWRDKEIIAVEPGETKDLYGFAVDIGTTKLAAYLVDLNVGRIVTTASAMNPQIAYGEDVISRIRYIMDSEENLARLHNVIVEGINHLINEVCQNAKIQSEDICDMTLAGNTAMHHVFLGILPTYVALMPYPAALQSPVDVRSRDLGVRMNQGSYIHALPIIAGFVGGDAVADVLATDIHETKDLSMLIDIGTNSEIVLGNKDRLASCSCASGPAFEGAHIKHGMRATTGAIDHVWIDPETYDVGYRMIDGGKPRGLCGSAIVDVTAEMLKVGLINHRGKFNIKIKTPRLRMGGELGEFVIAWRSEAAIESDIVVTQSDMREVQLAKAAIYSGASILMKRMAVVPQEIRRIFLAGAFGTYVDPQNARLIGMYPDVPLERVQFVGNTAGSGARMALLSDEAREKAYEIAKRVEYVELGADPNFQNEFLRATYLPHREMERFPNVSQILAKRKEVE